MSKYITFIQLRAARNVLNLGVRDIANLLKVSKATISNSELGKTRDFFYKHSPALINFFEQRNIIFPNKYSIRYVLPNSNPIETLNQEEGSLTRFQLITARHVLNISQQTLANFIGIDKGIISRGEKLSNEKYIKALDPSTILKIQTFYKQQNLDFPDPLFIFFKKYIDNELNN